MLLAESFLEHASCHHTGYRSYFGIKRCRVTALPASASDRTNSARLLTRC